MGGDVQGQTRLAHPGPAGDDDQISGLKSVGHGVELQEAGAQAREVVPGLLFEFLDRLLVDLVQGHERSRHRLLAQRHDGLFRVVQRFPGLQTTIECRLVDRRAGVDQAPAQSPLLDDLDVGVHPAEVGQIDLQRGEIGHPAGGFELVSLLQPCLHRAKVDRAVRLLESEHRLVQNSMPLGVVVLRLQADRGRRQVSISVEQDRGQDRALRLLAVRQAVCFFDRGAHGSSD